MRRILCLTTTVACLTLAGPFGCTPTVPEKDIVTPQEGEAAKAEMEKSAKDMQAEMEKMRDEMQQKGQRGPR